MNDGEHRTVFSYALASVEVMPAAKPKLGSRITAQRIFIFIYGLVMLCGSNRQEFAGGLNGINHFQLAA